MIKAIELTNWKTHEAHAPRFLQGARISFSGRWARGRAAIMDAISFALFGTYPALQHRRLGVGDIIMNWPEQKSSAQ